MLLPAAGAKREGCVSLSVGREPSSERRFARCEAKGEDNFLAVSPFPQAGISHIAPTPTAPLPANSAHLPFFRRADAQCRAAFGPLRPAPGRGRFCEILPPTFPVLDRRQFCTTLCSFPQVSCQTAARSASVPLQTGQTTVLRMQNARAMPWQVGCQTVAQSAPVTPPGRTDDGFANAKCRSGAAANRMSNSRARRACHSQAG